MAAPAYIKNKVFFIKWSTYTLEESYFGCSQSCMDLETHEDEKTMTFLLYNAFLEHSTGFDRDWESTEGPSRAPPFGQSRKWPSQYSHHPLTPA